MITLGNALLGFQKRQATEMITNREVVHFCVLCHFSINFQNKRILIFLVLSLLQKTGKPDITRRSNFPSVDTN